MQMQIRYVDIIQLIAVAVESMFYRGIGLLIMFSVFIANTAYCHNNYAVTVTSIRST